MFKSEVGGEVRRNVIGVSSGHGGTDGTDDLLSSVAVVACDVVHQARLSEPHPEIK
jgi:hypothetical protein